MENSSSTQKILVLSEILKTSIWIVEDNEEGSMLSATGAIKSTVSIQACPWTQEEIDVIKMKILDLIDAL